MLSVCEQLTELSDEALADFLGRHPDFSPALFMRSDNATFGVYGVYGPTGSFFTRLEIRCFLYVDRVANGVH